jgi:hypothetical protein
MKREHCYSILIENMKEIDLSANIERVQKTISNLRTVFRKEFSKQSKSRASGSGTDNVHTLKLWYCKDLSVSRTPTGNNKLVDACTAINPAIRDVLHSEIVTVTLVVLS